MQVQPDTVTQTMAVVLANTPAARLACDGGTVLGRLTEQLTSIPVAVRVVGRAGGDLADDLGEIAVVARAASAPLAIISGDVVAHTEAIAGLLEHPSRGTGALVGPPDPGAGPVRAENDRVVAAGNSFHQLVEANASFLGVLHVGAADLPSLAAVAAELSELAGDGLLGEARDDEAADLLLAGLVRSGVPVAAVPLGRLHAERVAGQEAADAAFGRLGAVDEERARLDAAVKQDDGFFSTYAVSTWSRHVVKAAAWLRVTPNGVTGISVGLAVMAAIWFSMGNRGAQVAGAVALYLSFVLDCVDGQLARYTRRFSPIGAWLDATFDRVKEYVVYVGLAIGYSGGAVGGLTGPDDIWALAVAAMLLQAIRHMVDFSYAGAVADAAKVGSAWGNSRRSLAVAADGARLVQLAGKFEKGTATRWAKKIIVLPIGERMALIAITAAFFNAHVTFVALLVWGGIAALYTLTGRIARSL
ncbi:CDP-alcohol phosphatidyltransferase family protein [Herbidospora mongoliensis]|uniref:CDP-alcohol phosphatidyltransferase family protein n=1 Tax=Herbidospora mongoliensis TaxID=688067 RepID=UPI00082CBF78|nr:CDP-alcohol phosphatidyltransferase family protein [Herbidospora mongoliensis]